MTKKYLVGPFLCTLSCWIVGNGTICLLPLYAIQRGASESGSGLFLAFAFGCLAIGTFAPGLLPKHFARRRLLLVAAGVVQVAALLLTSQTKSLVGLAAGCGAMYFLGGVVFTQATVLTGQAAPEKERGAAMGILGMSNGLGSVIGGLGAGWLADRAGFVGLWEVCSAVCLLVILGGLISVEEVQSGKALPAVGIRPASIFGTALVLMVAANLMLSVANAVANLGRSLSMVHRGFSMLTINLTMALCGAAGLILSFALGWLSDRIGRRRVLLCSYLVTAVAMIVLGLSRDLWHFYLAIGLTSTVSVCMAVGPAYVIDVVPGDSAAMGVSLFQAAFWAGNIAGPIALGFAFERFGMEAPILASVFFPLGGMVLLLLVRSGPKRVTRSERGPTLPVREAHMR